MNRETKKSEKLNIKNLIQKNPFLAVLVLVTCCLLGGLFAKYARKSETDPGQIISEHFYFTADIMGDTKMVAADGDSSDSYAFGEKSTEGTWYLYGGSQHTLDIKVQNYYDELRITDKNTAFKTEVSVTDGEGNTVEKNYGLKLIKTGTTETVDENSSVELTGGKKNSSDFQLVIPSNSEWNYGENITVTVKISSTAPYRKTLTLNFVLYAKEAALRYQVKDSVGSPYAELIIMTNLETSTGENVQPYITWSATLSIDNTNKLTFHYSNGTFTQQTGMTDRNMQISEALKTGESESIYFFKSNPSENHTTGETIVNPSADGKYTISLK